jgi:tRNA (guanine37-N1)-methyltransferase
MKTFHILTIFPEIFDSYFNESIIKRAQDNQNIEIKTYDLRDWTDDKHRSVDDSPYGGGAGMLMKVDVLYRAVTSIKLKVESEKNKYNKNLQPTTYNLQPTTSNLQPTAYSLPPTACSLPPTAYSLPPTKTILLSAKGRTWNQQIAHEHTNYTDIILICGRYEGVDERILNYIDEEISIGDFVMTGGELGAMVIVDSLTRLLPGVLGNNESANEESHSNPGVLEYPQYTRPEVFTDNDGHEHKVPDVLLSGNHAEIKKWRGINSKNK